MHSCDSCLRQRGALHAPTPHAHRAPLAHKLVLRPPAASQGSRCAELTSMADPSGGSYSIWAMPHGDLAHRLQSDIDRLAAEHAAPSFQPHVTLLGGTEQSEEDALRITADLAQSMQVYRIDFEDVSYGTIFHQCVYMRCRTDNATMQAAQQTRQAFGHTADVPYMPHLSLLYADIPPDARAEVAAREQQRLFGEDPLPADGFNVDSISLWYTIGQDKSLQSWRLVKDFPLKQQR